MDHFGLSRRAELNHRHSRVRCEQLTCHQTGSELPKQLTLSTWSVGSNRGNLRTEKCPIFDVIFSSEYEKTDKSTNRTVLRKRLQLGHLQCDRRPYREMTLNGCPNSALLTLKMLQHLDRRKEVESVGFVSRSVVSEFYVSHPFVCHCHEWVQSLCLNTTTFVI